MKTSLLIAACLAFCVDAAASRIVPAEPSAFQPVNLRTTVDSCVFVPSTVRVDIVANTLRITQQMNNCLVPGPIKVVDIRLGTLPTGSYRVEIYPTTQVTGTPTETLSFEVRELPEIAIYPPPQRPLADYSGMWWNPQESGWGLSIHQSFTHLVFATWFVYGASGQPEWFTIQGGHWIDSTTWGGTVLRTTGPYFAGASYDPRLVVVLPVGEATIDFAQSAAEENTARFTYTVNGATATKTIMRAGF